MAAAVEICESKTVHSKRTTILSLENCSEYNSILKLKISVSECGQPDQTVSIEMSYNICMTSYTGKSSELVHTDVIGVGYG